MSVAAIVLAAGASKRFGRPKQNEVLAGETLLQRAIRTAAEAGLSPIIVVIGNSIDPITAAPAAVEFVTNPKPNEGIASSIRCGIETISLSDLAGTVIMTCDQPAITATHLRSLLADESRVTGSRYAEIIGVPAYFPKAAFVQLKQLRGDSGARALLQGAHSVPANYLDLDVDTQQDLDRARALFEPNSHEAS